jgi:CelD/BcsL family acetyltransferase involved in cellulose biosynthesis
MVGLVPMFHESLRMSPIRARLRRLVGCDHSTTTCGVVLDPEFIAPNMELFAGWLDGQTDWDMLHWGPLAGYLRHTESVAEIFRLRSNGWGVRVGLADGPHIVWDLPASYEDFLASLSKKERSNIKIAFKRMAESGKVEEWEGKGSQTWFGAFVEQHQQQWQAEGKLGHFCDWPGATEFHRDLVESMTSLGRLWMLRLIVGGQAVGYQYNYRFGRRMHWLLGSRDPDSQWDAVGPGRVLLARAIEKAINQGFTGIDGLRGFYEYKLRLGGKVASLQSVTVVRNTVASRCCVSSVRYSARVLDLLYYRIWFSRIAPALRQQRRGLWRCWIRSRI